MDERKWAKLAFTERLNWGIRDNLWDNKGVKKNTHNVSKKKFWLNELYALAKETAKETGLEKVEHLETGIQTSITLPVGWNKHHLKTFFEGERIRKLTTEIEGHSTLKWLGRIHQDHDYDNRSQSWWLKAKMGSVRTQSRDNPTGTCIMCSADNEDMIHMLTCDKYPEKSITEIINVDTDHDHIWNWTLHFDRVFDIRVKISHWIRSRWKSRTRAIQMRIDHIPPVTELICH